MVADRATDKLLRKCMNIFIYKELLLFTFAQTGNNNPGFILYIAIYFYPSSLWNIESYVRKVSYPILLNVKFFLYNYSKCFSQSIYPSLLRWAMWSLGLLLLSLSSNETSVFLSVFSNGLKLKGNEDFFAW